MIINARTFLREYSYRRNVIFPETVTLEIGALFECTEKKISWEITILLINSTIFFLFRKCCFPGKYLPSFEDASKRSFISLVFFFYIFWKIHGNRSSWILTSRDCSPLCKFNYLDWWTWKFDYFVFFTRILVNFKLPK